MAKTLDEAGVKRLIQEIKGANKNLNTPIPISTENTPESMAQNVKNIADYVEKAKAAGIANVNGMGVTCLIDGENSGVGYLYVTNTQVLICGIQAYEDSSVSCISVIDGTYSESSIVVEGHIGQITSDMLIEGARKPIILTPETTEVDEETYQKLLSDNVDVVFKSDDNLCILTYKLDEDVLTLFFTCLSLEGDPIEDSYIYAYKVSITKVSPHTCSIINNTSSGFPTFIEDLGYLNKSTLTPVLQEIDLIGTDAERKAKLDQFETDWKALTGASDLTGARFVGRFNINDYNSVGLFNYNQDLNYEGISCSDTLGDNIYKVVVNPDDGSITITPLFSHLEAITIRTGNTPDDKAANVAAINAYVDNLTALGVDVTKGYMIPFYKYDTNAYGILVGNGTTPRLQGYLNGDNTAYAYVVTTDGTVSEALIQLNVDAALTTTSKYIVSAINEVNALAKSKQDALTSGTNIKTINGQSLLGSGDIAISGGGDVTKAGNNIFTGNNTFTTFVHFSRGIEITNANEDMHYYLDLDSNTNKFRISDDSDMDVEVTGVDTPTQDNAAANKKYVDDKVAAAGGGSAPVLIDINDITGSAGDSVPVDVFNKIANAASAKTPIFGYSKLVNGTRTTYDIIPLYVKNVSTTAGTNSSLSIQFIAENAYNSIGIMKRSYTECIILAISSRPFALDTSVDKSSTRGIQSSAVWKEIHSEPMTVNTATSGVTTLSSTDKHKILCYADSGTQQYNLPTSPVDGETFLFLKVKSGHTIIIQSGTGNENIYDCSSGNSVVSKTIASSTKMKITVTYSSTVGKWFLMANDFIS